MLIGGIRWGLKTDTRFGQVAQGRKRATVACLGMMVKNVKTESIYNSSKELYCKKEERKRAIQESCEGFFIIACLHADGNLIDYSMSIR